MLKKWLLALCFFLIPASIIYGENVPLVTGEWPPYTSEEMEGYGFAAAIVSAVFEEMGEQAEYTFYPWRRCFEMVKKGKAWAAFPYSYTKGRAQDVLFSDPIASTNTYFFYYHKTGTRPNYTINSLDDLTQYKIGGSIGYFYEDAFKKAGLDVNYSIDEVTALKKLINGKIDLLPVNQSVAWYLINTHFPEEAEYFGVVDIPYQRGEVYLVASRQYPDSEALLERFNRALRTLRENGAYKAIVTQHGLRISE